jgi:hypothetical protein
MTAVSARHHGGNAMRQLLTGAIVVLLGAATLSQAQEAKPRAYTLIVSGAR